MFLTGWDSELFPQTAVRSFPAVLDPSRCAVVAGRNDMFVLNDDRSEQAGEAGRPLGSDIGQLHKK